jgi:hypothetical protein
MAGVVACSSSAPAAPISQACGSLFDALVERDRRCSQASSDFSPENRENFVRDCLLRTKATGVGYGAPLVDGCAKAVSAERSACLTLDDFVACRTPRGTLGDGAACMFDTQCSGGLCRAVNAKVGGCGVCAPLLAQGAACSGSGTEACDRGLVCLAGKCAPPAQEGQACVAAGGTEECVKGLFCDKGLCAKLPGKGAPCSLLCAGTLVCATTCVEPVPLGGKCLENECGPNLVCAGGKCADLTVVQAGGVCGTANTRCDKGLECVFNEIDAKCEAFVPENGACTQNGAPCKPFLACTDGVCAYADSARCK